MESTVKQINHRVKGTEKFWCNAGVEAILQLRADYLSDTSLCNTTGSNASSKRLVTGATAVPSSHEPCRAPLTGAAALVVTTSWLQRSDLDPALQVPEFDGVGLAAGCHMASVRRKGRAHEYSLLAGKKRFRDGARITCRNRRARIRTSAEGDGP